MKSSAPTPLPLESVGQMIGHMVDGIRIAEARLEIEVDADALAGALVTGMASAGRSPAEGERRTFSGWIVVKDRSGLVHLRGGVRTNGAGHPGADLRALGRLQGRALQLASASTPRGGTTESEYVEVAANGRVTPKTRTTTTCLALDDVSFRP